MKANKFNRFQCHHNPAKRQPTFSNSVEYIPFVMFNGRLAVQRRQGVLSPATAHDYSDFLRWRASNTPRIGKVPELIISDYNAMRKLGIDI